MRVKTRPFAFGLAALLAASTAAADTVITAEEVIACSVESADTGQIRLKLPQGGSMALRTSDIYEVRLSDSGRVAELSGRLPQSRVVPDPGGPVPPPATRALEMLRVRLERLRRARAEGLPWNTDILDTLERGAALSEIEARCRQISTVLLECGRGDQVIAELLRESNREEEALHRIWPAAVTSLVGAPLGALPGAYIGAVIGDLIQPPPSQGCQAANGGAIVGCPVGCLLGAGIGAGIGMQLRKNTIAWHRNRVNALIFKINYALRYLQ